MSGILQLTSSYRLLLFFAAISGRTAGPGAGLPYQAGLADLQAAFEQPRDGSGGGYKFVLIQ
jgi:hypothetical protein